MNIELKQLSSLQKVFLDSEISNDAYTAASALKNEVFSYQIAYKADLSPQKKIEANIKIESELSPFISIRKVGYVPSQLPLFSDLCDEDYIKSTPGLYPDPLFEIKDEIEIITNAYHSLFITVRIPHEIEAKKYPIKIIFSNDDFSKEMIFHLNIIDAVLPKQKLIFTQWLHADCIASYYDYQMLSDNHWEMIDKYMKTAVKNGINMILTPVFTLPLDTKVGGERPTLQLVDIKISKGKYIFSFDNLKKWIDMAKSNGISYFEICHLFSQWGAKYTPKIMANEDGIEKRIFGWETEASCEAYKKFLSVFLPEFIEFLEEEKIDKLTYFHISDEPQGQEQKETYRLAKEIVKPYLKDFKIIDALSEYAFYKEKIVENPIPAIDHIEEFIENSVPNLWCYYCCVQAVKVSNRFFAMPSYRNRIIATALFKFDIEGFLHWGFNFYYSQYSKEKINPFLTTDAMSAFPSGDSFGVYPGKDGPIEALSLVVFHEALQDLRAFELLKSLTSKEFVLELMEKDLKEPLSFKEYPRNEDYLLNLREKVNMEIDKVIKKRG